MLTRDEALSIQINNFPVLWRSAQVRINQLCLPAHPQPWAYILDSSGEGQKVLLEELSVLRIPAVSLWQIWASLIPLGLKRWETRPSTISWKNYRGRLLIHAASERTHKPGREEIREIARLIPQDVWVTTADLAQVNARQFVENLGIDLPYGAIVGLCEMTDAIQMTQSFIDQQSPLERAVGNWQPGRLAIQLSSIQPITSPVACAGAQGLWTPPESVLKQIFTQTETKITLPQPAQSQQMSLF